MNTPCQGCGFKPGWIVAERCERCGFPKTITVERDDGREVVIAKSVIVGVFGAPRAGKTLANDGREERRRRYG